MKVKRYLIDDVVDSYPRFWNGDEKLVLAEHYDSLLVLARRLRIELVSYAKEAPVMCDDIAELIEASKWLEE